MDMLTKADILDACTRKAFAFDVPEWEGAVLLRPLDLGQRIAFTQVAMALQDGDTIGNLRAQFGLVANSIVDAEGAPLMTPAEVELMERTGFRRVMAEVRRINDMDADTPEQDAKK